MVNNKTTVNTLGIDFIKNYNWILDFKNSSVYYKRIKKKKNLKSLNIISKVYL